MRQAAILFRFAKATRDPEISAALMEKAADLKLQVDEPGADNLNAPFPGAEIRWRVLLSCGLILPMWTRCKACDACQIAPATVETEAGFFLCDDCEPVVVVEFQEFELPPRRSAIEWVFPQQRQEPS